jgi:hypothetical protein
MASSRAEHITPSHELLGLGVRDRRPINSNNPGCGRPANGNLCVLSELAAVAFSFICSAAALGTVFVNSNAAYLGGVNQLIVLGAPLTLMNLCTEKLATIVFLQIEVQRKSLLHNYDIIIKRSFLGSLAKSRKGSFIWAALLSISLGLPLVLGIRRSTCSCAGGLNGWYVALRVAIFYIKGSVWE